MTRWWRGQKEWCDGIWWQTGQGNEGKEDGLDYREREESRSAALIFSWWIWSNAPTASRYFIHTVFPLHISQEDREKLSEALSTLRSPFYLQWNINSHTTGRREDMSTWPVWEWESVYLGSPPVTKKERKFKYWPTLNQLFTEIWDISFLHPTVNLKCWQFCDTTINQFFNLL